MPGRGLEQLAARAAGVACVHPTHPGCRSPLPTPTPTHVPNPHRGRPQVEFVDDRDKLAALMRKLDSVEDGLILVFVETKRSADELECVCPHVPRGCPLSWAWARACCVGAVCCLCWRPPVLPVLASPVWAAVFEPRVAVAAIPV